MSPGNGKLDIDLVKINDLNNKDYDGIILIASPEQIKNVSEFSDILLNASNLDDGFNNETTIIPINYNAKRLIYSPTGKTDQDYDDVRIFRKAANVAIKRAIKAGVKSPLLYLIEHQNYENSALVTLLGILEGLYVPIQIRDLDPKKLHKITKLGIFSKPPINIENVINIASALESGRRVACDIGDADPERMSPPKVEEYLTELFKNSTIKMNVIKDVNELKKEYPLFEAVNRAASNVERHQGRIIFLEYNPPLEDVITKTLFLVGKGVTYDTGGADVKYGGIMAGMSRDKCGAAAIAGFLQIVNILKPKHLKIVAGLSMVRNSIGSNSYVSDELIKARSGVLVRIGNTDAEGRMVMTDVLCKLKEMAKDAVNPHLYTIATLTGHAVLSVGIGYSIVMDNGPARKEKHAEIIKEKGTLISEPFEISTLRKDDIDFNKGKALGDDLLQCNNAASSRTPRGHQIPVGFMLVASKLDEHGSSSSLPLKYSHLDIAASAGDFPDPATGAPVLALANTYLFN